MAEQNGPNSNLADQLGKGQTAPAAQRGPVGAASNGSLENGHGHGYGGIDAAAGAASAAPSGAALPTGSVPLANDARGGLRLWRALIVAAFVVFGLIVGYQLGVQLVSFAIQDSDAPVYSFIGQVRLLFYNHPGTSVIDALLCGAVGGLIAFLVGSAAFYRIHALRENVQGMRANEKVALFVGVLAGLLITLFSGLLLIAIPKVGWLLTIFVAVLSIFFCTAIAFSMKESFQFGAPPAEAAPAAGVGGTTSSQVKILDTNVIIDGRVSDVCRTGFIEGTIYVPGFILDELQHIADSSDSLKRARGRRGLDILNQMRSEFPLLVRSLDAQADLVPNEQVDYKLVKLAKKINGALVTNDFNLNKVAELQGIPVLNINELANALKPVVLPGEEMRVTVIKEGKEMSQGIGYLDDGTMIVIDGARRRIGDTLDVIVSSVLQTVAGKMIFATIRPGQDDDYDSEHDPDGGGGGGGNGHGYGDHGSGGSRPYPGRGPRRPFRDR